MKWLVLISMSFVATVSYAGENKVAVAIEGSCELILTAQDREAKMSDEFKLHSSHNSTSIMQMLPFANPLHNHFLFSLFWQGETHLAGEPDKILGDVYVLAINPIFDPNDFYEFGGIELNEKREIVTYGFKEDALSAGKIRGQTSAYINITVDRETGSVKAHTYIGSPTRKKRIESVNGELNISLPYSMKANGNEAADGWFFLNGKPMGDFFAPLSRIFRLNRNSNLEIERGYNFEFRVHLKFTADREGNLRLDGASDPS